MLKRIILTAIVFFAAVAGRAADSSVKLNSLGFVPGIGKGVTCSETATTFEVRRAGDDAVMYTGTFSSPVYMTDSAENLYKGDFSLFNDAGSYYVRVYNGGAHVGNSVTFNIAYDVYRQPYIDSMRAMYLMRCGTAVSGDYGGDTFSHAACHINDANLFYVTGMNDTKPSTGGWHDAGDYNKYTVNAGVTVGMLFMAWEHFQPVLSGISLGIPDTAPGYPDFLKEMKWEIDWLFSMQMPDGSVLDKVSTESFGGFILPDYETTPRYFFGYNNVGTVETAAFCAMMSMAARNFYPYDAPYAVSCLAAAEGAWQYLVNNPTNTTANISGCSTGNYTSSDPNAGRLWAAAELWATGGRADVHSYFTLTVNNYYSNKIDSSFDWGNLKNLAMYTYLTCTRTGKNTSIYNDIINDLTFRADAIVTARNTHGYARPFGSSYGWGCNGAVARQTMLLQLAYMVTSNQAYIDTAADAVGHLFGRNYFRRSFVTGMGDNPPMNPHDRRSGGDSVANPWPGCIVGGSPGYAQDSTLSANVPAGSPPAYYWVDLQGSYASNEIAINWQGALIYALAGLIRSEPVFTPTYTPTFTETPTYTNTPTGTLPTSTETGTATPTPTITPTAKSSELKLVEYYTFPNPSKGGTVNFYYELEGYAENVYINIYTMGDRKIQTIRDVKKNAGPNSTSWKPKFKLANGLYYYSITFENKKQKLIKTGGFYIIK